MKPVQDYLDRAVVVYRKNSLRIKIMVFIFVLCAVSTIILSAVYRKKSEALIADSFVQATADTLYQISQAHGMMFTTILDSTKQLYGTKTLGNIMRKTTINSYDDIIYLHERVTQFQYSIEYTSSAYFYLPRAGRVYSSNMGFFDMSDFDDPLFEDWYYAGSTRTRIINTHAVSYYGNNMGNTKFNVVSICVRLPYGHSQRQDGAFVINMRHSDLYKAIPYSSRDNPGSRLFIVDSSNHVIFSPDEELLYNDLSDVLGVAFIADPGKQHIIEEIDGRKNLIVYNHNNNWGWTYVLISPWEPVLQSTRSINQTIVIALLSIIALALIAALWLGTQTVRPVNQVIAELLDIGSEQPHVPQLRYIQQTVAGIIQENRRIQDRINQALPEMRRNFLISILNRGDLTREEILVRMQAMNMKFAVDDLYLALIAIDDTEPSSAADSYLDSSIIRISLEHEIESVFDSPVPSHLLIDYTDDLYALVVQSSTASVKNLVALLHRLQERILINLSLVITVSLYDLPVSVDTLFRARKEAEENLRFRLLYGQGEFIRYSGIETNKNRFSYPDDVEESLVNTILAGDSDRAMECFRRLVESVREHGSLASMRECSILLTSRLLRLLASLHIPADEVFPVTASPDTHGGFTSYEEMCRIFEQVIVNTTNVINKSKVSRLDTLVQRINDYIVQNYRRDISLDDASSAVGISRSYVNQVLSLTGRTSFVQYLNDYRIMKACDLFENDELSVKEISQAVGFNSSRYFIRLFKKMKGVTPGAYKDTVNNRMSVK